jgi:hypothetical protein
MAKLNAIDTVILEAQLQGLLDLQERTQKAINEIALKLGRTDLGVTTESGEPADGKTARPLTKEHKDKISDGQRRNWQNRRGSTPPLPEHPPSGAISVESALAETES